MQKRVNWLLTQLGESTRDVCASNVAFARSVAAKGIGFREWADRCWPVHRAIIAIVKPRLVLVFGSDPYEYVREQFKGEPMRDYPAEHGSWKCRASKPLDGPALIGLPHLARYNVINKTRVVERIKEIVGLA